MSQPQNAEPTYWLCGLLSFCAKNCEAKTAEAGGEPDFRTSKERKQDNAAPALEPACNSLALMQTVVMSFARGLYVGKPELPIDHVHVSFPFRAQGHRPVQGTKAQRNRACCRREIQAIWTMLLTTLMSLWGSLKENVHMNNIPQPYAATDDWSQTVRDWEWHVNEVMPAGYLASTYHFRRHREAGTELDFFRLVDCTVALPNVETTPPDTGASGRPQASASSASSRQ